MREEFFSHHHIGPFFHRQARRLVEKLRIGTFPDPAFKEYSRMPQFALPPPLLPKRPLEELIGNRRSSRKFSQKKVLTDEEISSVLFYGFGAQRGTHSLHTNYPSGGARYPLEVYLVRAVSGGKIPAGLYHYHPQHHALARLLEEDAVRVLREKCLTYSFSRKAEIIIIVTAVWHRNFIKYLDFGYSMVLLEAGHASQNVLLAAESLGLSACPLAGFHFDETCELLDIDGVTEAPLHMIALGRADEKTPKDFQEINAEDESADNDGEDDGPDAPPEDFNRGNVG